MKVLVVGSIALDTVVTPACAATEDVGGSAFYFAHAARLLAPVALVGVVGEDFPQDELQSLDDLGIDRSGLEITPGRTFRWTGRYFDDMNSRETLKTELNVLGQFQPKLPAPLRASKAVFLANMEPEHQLAVLAQVSKPGWVACDSMNLWILNHRDALLEVLKKVDVFFLNDEEARMLTGHKNLLTAGRAVCELGPSWVVLKRGEHGSMLFGRDSVFIIPGFPVAEVQDPTGAGDSFAGAVMGFLAWRKSKSEDAIRSALAMGTVIASFTVEGFGVRRLKALKRSEVSKRLQAFVDMTHFALEWSVLEEWARSEVG